MIAATQCPTPPPINSGSFRGTNFRVGQSVTYVCLPGFQLVGEPTLVCEATGDWSGSPPSCQGELTRHMDNITLRMPEVIHFDCKRQSKIFLLHQTRGNCRLQVQWNNFSVLACARPETLPNGRFLPARDSYRPGESVVYSCDPGYRLSGGLRRTCQISGQWSSAPTCSGENRCFCDPHE